MSMLCLEEGSYFKFLNVWKIKLDESFLGGVRVQNKHVLYRGTACFGNMMSVVALGIANLIGGLSALGHSLKDLKASQPREEGSETNAQVDKYYELLGKRENSLLHAFVAILSFLIFGLVPPIVYGFSFRESDDKHLKLVAVAGASLICIALLAIAKAYIQRTTYFKTVAFYVTSGLLASLFSYVTAIAKACIQRTNTYMTYFKTVAFYVTSGVLASLITYVAGTLIKRFVEQLGWFQPKSNFVSSLPKMTVEKSGWDSY